MLGNGSGSLARQWLAPVGANAANRTWPRQAPAPEANPVAPAEQSPTPERVMIERVRRGDTGAFRQIVEAHQERVFYLALGLLGQRSDAEDVMQEVFIKAYRSLSKFRGESGLATWLYRITHNACRDWQRRQRWWRKGEPIDQAVEAGSEWTTTDPGADPERGAGNRQLSRDLMVALERLTPTERSVFVLRHFQQLSTRETAEVLMRAEGSVKNLLFRAMHKLKDALAAHYGSPAS